MLCVVSYVIKLFLSFMIVFGVGIVKIHAQNDHQALKKDLQRLKDSYTWGSIYITYSSIRDFNLVLNNSIKIGRIKKTHGNRTYLLLKNLINQSGLNRINRSTAIIEIDLKIPKVGYVKANNVGGTITSVPLGYYETIRIAVLCDKLLKGQYFAQILKERLDKPELALAISVEDTVTYVQSIYNNPYVSQPRANLSLFGLRKVLENKSQSIENLRTSNKGLHKSISMFKKTFDMSVPKNELKYLQVNKRFSLSYLQKIERQYEVKQSEINRSLEKASSYIISPRVEKTELLEPKIRVPLKQLDQRIAMRGYSIGRKFDIAELMNSKWIKKPVNIYGKIGEQISTNEFDLTVLGFNKTQKMGDDVASVENTFLSVELVVESKSAKGVPVYPAFVSIKDEKNYEYGASENGKEPLLRSQLLLPKGEKIRGWITFLVPKNKNKFKLIYEMFFVSPTRISIILEK